MSDKSDQLQADLVEVHAENIRLRAALANSKDPCVYCQLPAAEIARCKAGFPGCARADDMAGCPEFGAMMDVAQLTEELSTARAALREAVLTIQTSWAWHTRHAAAIAQAQAVRG